MPRPTWHNTLGNVRLSPERIERPTTPDDVARVVRDAERRGGRVHAVGRGLSFTGILHADDVLVSTEGLVRRRTIDPATLRAGVDAAQLVEVEAGVVLGDVARELFAEGRGFGNLPGCLRQSVVGAAATATHGSGVTLGSLADDVRSVEIVVQGGELIRLEGDDGPTDHVAWAAKHPDVRLLRDESLFRAALVHLGVFGVVTAVRLSTRSACWLRERRYRAPWSSLRSELDALARRHRHVEVWIDPHPRDGDRVCLVTARDEDAPGRTREPWLRRAHEELVTRPTAGRAVVALGNRVDAVFRGTIEASFGWLADRERRGPAHEILDLGKPTRVATSAGEFALDMAHAAEAAERVLAVYDRLRARGLRGPSLPFSLRFVAASKALLSPCFGRESVTVEVPNFDGTAIGAEALAEIDASLEVLGARPHWSQLHRERTAEELARSYPGFGSWVAARGVLAGSGVFDNGVTDRLGISVRPGRDASVGAMAPREERAIDARRPNPMRHGSWLPAKREVQRFVVGADASSFSAAFEAVLTEPGRHFGVVRVRRPRAAVGRPFAVGTRFQGGFSLAAVARAKLGTSRVDGWLEAPAVVALLDRVEAAAFSNFAELTEIERSPAPGAPHRFAYRYLEGTPIAGRSVYLVEDLASGGARVTHEFEYQEINGAAAVTFQLLGLREHMLAVESQVAAATERLGASMRVERSGG